MSSSPDILRVVVTIDRAEMARRGRLGGLATQERPDAGVNTEAARSAFLSRFSSDTERRAYFAELSRRGVAARRARAEGEGGAR